MSKEETLLQEQSELSKLIGEGVDFEIEVTHLQRKPGIFGYFRKRDRITEKRKFKIAEPTLSTLDRLTALWLQIEIDETRLKDEDYLQAAKKLAAKEARKLAEVVAMAVLGEDYYDTIDHGGRFEYKPNTKRFRDLTNLFLHSVKPSELLTLAVIITNVSNLGDFTNSIFTTYSNRAKQRRKKDRKNTNKTIKLQCVNLHSVIYSFVCLFFAAFYFDTYIFVTFLLPEAEKVVYL